MALDLYCRHCGCACPTSGTELPPRCSRCGHAAAWTTSPVLWHIPQGPVAQGQAGEMATRALVLTRDDRDLLKAFHIAWDGQ